jgi:Mg/Co/Ni transporter MgtE
MKKSTLECFDAMINKFHISSIPVVDENNKYLGLIY